MAKVYAPLKDLKGEVFGELTVIRDSGRRDSCRQILWECKCSCGNTTYVPTRSLTSSRTKSCGCLTISRCKQGLNLKHGLCETRLYSIWVNMKSRCCSPSHNDYQNYGGRGIKVCDEWLHSFQKFYDWATSNGYSDSLTIDRKDNNGEYSPSNCRWVTGVIQANNKRNNVVFEYKGECHTLAEWGRIVGIHYITLRKRINHLKWSISKAIETPVRTYNSTKEVLFNG